MPELTTVLIGTQRKRTGLLAIIVVMVALALVACTDSEDSTATSAPPTATTTSPQPTAELSATDTPTATEVPPPSTTTSPTSTSVPQVDSDDESEGIGVTSSGGSSEILTDSDGMTLYIFDRDTEGVSNCSGGCLNAWPPLIVDETPTAASGVTAVIGTITLADGTKQATVNGFPAYRFQSDSAEGDRSGNGVGNNWWVFNTDGTPQRPAKVRVSTDAEMGDILVGTDGLSLYIFDRDTEGTSNCSGGCLSNWPPLLAEYGAVAVGDITATIETIDRGDGVQQVTINGFPAYYWKGDVAEGDTLGHGVGNNWWVFNADGTPQRPAKVSISTNADMGDILVGTNGLTLYIFDRDTEGVSNCSGGCLGNWPPLLAEYGAVAVGDVAATVSTIDRGDGVKQVTINGFPAYYWKGDVAEGDTLGHGVGGVWWVFEADGAPQRPAKIGISTNNEMGDILVGAGGRSLYIFDRDTEGVSNCSGGCLGNWPPLLAEHGAVAIGDFAATVATIDRGDGSMQVTINGFPAYYWKGDVTEGDTSGNGVGNSWWVFNADGTPQRPAKISISTNSEMGDILVGASGLSLYIFDRDTDGVSNCSGGCLGNWPPLLAEYGAVAIGDITGTIATIDRGDGIKQVTINGFPAYYWKGDVTEGDTSGNGVGNNWWVFNADGTPQRPAKIALAEHSSLGSILTDGAGMSLYLFDNDTAGMSSCSGGCLNSWPALLTEYGTVATNDVTGTLGTITRGDGSLQVTVNDMPVYYWVNDAAAGDAGGHSLGSVWWLLNAEGNAIRQLVEATATPTPTAMPTATAVPVSNDGY